MALTKVALRKAISGRIAALSDADKARQSVSIVEQLLSDERVRAAHRVALYVAMPRREVDLERAFEALWRDGKKGASEIARQPAL